MNAKILDAYSIPLHRQLVSYLKEKIISGNFKRGDFIGTEKSLMETFGVSSTTIRRALQILSQEGYIFRKAGKGTFVRRVDFKEFGGPLLSFYEEMESLGLRPSSKVLKIEAKRASPLIAEKLNLSKSEKIYYIKKLLCANGEKIAILDSYWLFAVGERLSRYNLNSTNLLKILEYEVGISLGEAEGTIEARVATPEEARLLNIKKKSPVLIMQRTVFSLEGHPIFFSRFVYRADKYKYHLRMVRGPFKSIKNKTLELNKVQ